MPAANITRSVRFASETGISGSEANEVEIPFSPDQAISAATEEEVTIAHQATDLQMMAMRSDQDVGVMILETRFAVLATVAGPPGTITHTGDLEQEIFQGDLVRLEGTVGDDGVYMVNTVVEGAGTTTITLLNGQALPAGAGGAVGNVSRVASKNIRGYAYDITSTTLATGVIVVAGNVTDKFAALEFLGISGTAGNDGYWEIDSVTLNGANTDIVVNQTPGGAIGLPATEGAVGDVFSVSSVFSLEANTPFLWSIDSGIQNPLIHPNPGAVQPPVWNVDRGNVVAIMVDNTGNAVAAQFDARIATNSNIF